MSILRDDRLAFGAGTKARKFFGIHRELETKKIRSIVLQGELHSNALGAFSFLFRVFGYEVYTIAYARNLSKVTANSVLVKRNSHRLEIFSSRKEWENRIESFSTTNEESVLIPEYGMCSAATNGLDFLWKRIQISEYDRLVLDIGSGLVWLSANDSFGKRIPIYGVSVGLPKRKMIPWLEEKQKSLGFTNFVLDSEKIIESPFSSGFGSENPQVLEYSKSFYQKNGILLEPIYSANSVAAVQSRIDSGEWKGRTLYLHQGGLLNFLDRF
ncbi:1-aminocyclopropane-1-carboxylate deaminase [Leptospira kmetyi]|uniref:1-aminocyclopropane-1-carboxylate deaminase n=1 Tax=Leptospira kmetyi TaxID=408139 RepID=UPI001AEFDCF8|nr:1-aminocyclopropane-1-carboxylate deaminase [Leptospira kmetyi]